MAKRKRLSPARGWEEADAAAGLETKAMPFSAPAPIASVASDASASAALSELTDELARARAEGRMVLELPLERVVARYLVRDRIAVDADEMAALVESIRDRGQQTPIEVARIEDGVYGLISGWRRLQALEELHRETGEDRFATVRAFLRSPEEASDAYLAMVEENEVRVGLSYYERARIVAKAVEHGAYPSHKKALQSLFRSASRAKRSKIGSYLVIVGALDAVLRYPQGIGERLGLRLAKALEADPRLGARIAEALRARPAGSAEAEAARLAAALAPPAPAPAPARGIGPGERCRLAGDVELAVAADGSVTLSGAGVDAAFRARLLRTFGVADDAAPDAPASTPPGPRARVL
ncbi:ParB-like nuclease [Oceanicola granulosus HTCC2516]|uniref:ParB-like nuclease n=1 Tax=Oceanicola granulosus (strain ATCC BAA-861 / DSM 15982 / KCTC 12143 / HTCC2516) TaxID=314256 RepID=Q2CBR2_OCEGH|nr:ParB N-terminal domain-containing protein [Oceanicola granulosus]EAR50142.1 ParB-like nuclease [Oceanicola granulosus HTCC2516]